MLVDILDSIIYAANAKEVDDGYKELAKLGIDRHTAGIMVRGRIDELTASKGGIKNAVHN